MDLLPARPIEELAERGRLAAALLLALLLLVMMMLASADRKPGGVSVGTAGPAASEAAPGGG